MAQVFRPRANGIAVMVLAGMLLGLIALGLLAYGLTRSSYATGVGYAPQQPVPFSHKHHVGGLGLDCRYCHTGVERSGFAGIPPTRTCMTCHSQLWTNAAMLEPVRRSLAEGRPLRWVRVHDLADYVYFNHSVHVNNGVGCESCHGRVDRMPLMTRAEPLSMRWCLACHRDPAPHLRPADKVTAMGYDPAQDGIPGRSLVERYGIFKDRLIECYTCHR